MDVSCTSPALDLRLADFDDNLFFFNSTGIPLLCSLLSYKKKKKKKLHEYFIHKERETQALQPLLKLCPSYKKGKRRKTDSAKKKKKKVLKPRIIEELL